jgi:hypothetical protein
MKYLKYVLLMAALAAVWGGFSAGSAGATVLCTTAANCLTAHNGGGGQMYVKGDTIKSNAMNLQFTTSVGTITCVNAELNFELTGTGAPGAFVPGKVTVKFKECTIEDLSKKITACGEVHGQNIVGEISLGTAPNGTLTMNTFFPMVCPGVLECALGGKDMKIPITGGNPASITATKMVLERQAGGTICPESAELDATYKTTTPAYVYGG